MITKFSGNTTLNQALEELEDNEAREITRIMPTGNSEWWFEYE